ncbi:UPF0175 family protein [Anaerolineales bacterium HSG6]|nr:UPF0175 family protein [Anaerolineales bacterium HSG6]
MVNRLPLESLRVVAEFVEFLRIKAQLFIPTESGISVLDVGLRADELSLQKVTVEEAINLYLTDQYSLSRAAELANLTQWELKTILSQRGTPVRACNDYDTIETLDDRVERFWTHPSAEEIA